MKLRDLRDENPNHYNDSQAILLSSVRTKRNKIVDSESPTIERIKSGAMTLADWLTFDQDALIEFIRGLESFQQEVAMQRLLNLYDLWLEYFVQHKLMREFFEVQHFAPHKASEKALALLGELPSKLAKRNNAFDDYRFNKGLNQEADFVSLLNTVQTPGYISQYNIHDKDSKHEAEALVRYQTYLKAIGEQGLQTEDSVVDPDLNSLAELCPQLVQLSRSLVVKYQSRRHYYKENSYVDYTILSLGNCSDSWMLQKKMMRLFDVGYEKLMTRIRTLSESDQTNILEALGEETEELKYIVTDGTYEEEEDEFGPATTRHFKRFKHIIYAGDNDIHFSKSERSRLYLDKKLKEFAEGWLEQVGSMLRKIEHALNNLHLFRHSRETPKFDTAAIFSNIFVVEASESALQGTAFHMAGIGIVTCDHCVRNPESDELIDEIIIYRGADLKKVPVKIVKADKDYDIAILGLVGDHKDFLTEGLDAAFHDQLKPLDPVIVAGFPNYNYGDEGYVRRGEITGFRKIHGVPHVMVSAALVAGNSGGPVFDMEGNVIGVVVTGSDNFANSDSTEKHGFLPISLLKFLEG